MAIIWQDSMDRYAQQSDLSQVYNFSAATIELTGGRYGAGAMYLQGGLVSYAYFAVPGLPTEIWKGFSVNIKDIGSPQSGILYTFIGDKGVECYVIYNQLTAQFQVVNGLTNAVLAHSEPLLLTSGSWHWIDLHFILGSSGTVEIWVDNNQYLDAIGINTAPQGSANILTGCFGYPFSLNSLGMYLDDPVVENPSISPTYNRIGDSLITISVPASDASPNDGTPSSGSSHFAMVNEAQWEDTNYITLNNTTGQAEQFSITPLPVTPQFIFAVQVVSWCEKTDAGTANVKLYIDSDATTSLGASKGLPSPWGILTQLYNQDPHTSASWTESGVNDVELGAVVQ